MGVLPPDPPIPPSSGGGSRQGHHSHYASTFYTTSEQVAADAQALTDFVSVAIPVETFILFTTLTLQEEEMVRQALPNPPTSVLGILTPKHGAPLAIVASPGRQTTTKSLNPGLQAIWVHYYSGERPHQHQPPCSTPHIEWKSPRALPCDTTQPHKGLPHPFRRLFQLCPLLKEAQLRATYNNYARSLLYYKSAPSPNPWGIPSPPRPNLS